MHPSMRPSLRSAARRAAQHLAAGMFCCALLAAVAGCGPAAQTARCASLCNTYRDCFDGAHDVTACITQCRDRSLEDAAFVKDLDACDACLTEEACAAPSFPCASGCAGVLPAP